MAGRKEALWEDTEDVAFICLGDTGGKREVGGKEDVQVSDLINWVDGSSSYRDQEPWRQKGEY